MTVSTAGFAAFACLAPMIAPLSPASAASLTTIYTFQGAPTDGYATGTDLIYQNGLFYGVSPEGGPGYCRKKNDACGVIFSLDPDTGTEEILYSFTKARLGKELNGHLLYSGGQLYGTTVFGGASDNGEVFDFDLKTSKFKVLYSFAGSPNDGSLPSGNLLVLNGSLYGTTGYGPGCSGSSCGGTVYKLDLATGAESIVYNFQGGSDGAGPSGVYYENGLLYGTTLQGGGSGCLGSDGCGTMYSVDPTSGAEAILHIFGQGSDGANPYPYLTFGNGVFYGTTVAGGAQQDCVQGGGCGAVFSFDTSSQTEEVLYNFGSDSQGYALTDRLVYDKNVLYGTTTPNAGDGNTVAFKISLTDGKFSTLLKFPYNGLANDLVLVGNDLYGTVDGPSADGSIFKLIP